jgi:hypothetical protein
MIDGSIEPAATNAGMTRPVVRVAPRAGVRDRWPKSELKKRAPILLVAALVTAMSLPGYYRSNGAREPHRQRPGSAAIARGSQHARPLLAAR